MASARYWRLVGLRTAGGGDLELFALHWYSAGTRSDASASLTCSHTPASGALATLQGTTPAQTVRFAGADVASAGFWLQWDFGAAVVIDGVRLGGVDSARHLLRAQLEYRAADGRWLPALSEALGDWPFPGAGTLDALREFDRLAEQTTLLMRFDDGMRDLSFNAYTVGVNGAATLDASKAKSAPASLYLPGAAWLTPDLACAPRGTEDWCIEAWVNVPSYGSQVRQLWSQQLAGSYVGLNFELRPDGAMGLYVGSSSSNQLYIYGTTPIGTNVWRHVAATRQGNTFRLFQNGALAAQGTLTLNYPNPISVRIGREAYVVTTWDWVGNIDDLRVTRGDARYTAAFTPKSWDFSPRGVQAVSVSRLRTAAAAEGYAPSCRSAGTVRSARDVEFGGLGRVFGTTKAKGSPNTPRKSRVRLLRERDGLLAREVWSDPASGAFEFTGVDAGTRWVVLAQDASGAFWPAAASSFDLEVLP